MKYFGVLTIPLVTPLLNETLRMHHRDLKRLQARMAWEVRIAAGRQMPPAPLKRARVTIERRSVGTPDHDNLVGGVKQLVDVLLAPQVLKSKRLGGAIKVRHALGLGFVADDAPSVLELVVLARRVGRLEQGTMITIEELEPLPCP